MDISVIIPAYNEEGRIGNVLSPLVEFELIKEIIVVNDGSNDGTSKEARKYPITVIDISQNLGKAAAMKRGLMESKGEWILFLDADLNGLSREHIISMVDCTLKEDVDMVIGVFTQGKLITDISHKIAPFLSGQRLIKRVVLERVPISDNIAYGIEIVITDCLIRMGCHVKKVFMPYVYHIPKELKRGWWKGKKEKYKMYANLLATLFQLYLMPQWIKNFISIVHNAYFIEK